nr:polyprenyl synthetase family protein [Lachnospiraceae bacterium]
SVEVLEKKLELQNRKIKALQILAKKAGVYGMVGGQVVDVALTGKTPTKEQLKFIYELKTSALLQAALMVGACLAGADDETLLKVEMAGLKLGMAFQIQDDILDITSTTKKLGKPVHSDEKNKKVTFVTLEGIEDCMQMVEDFSHETSTILDKAGCNNPFLFELIERMINREN